MTDTKAAVVHLDDLAEPRFSPEAQQIRDMMAMMAPECPLDAEVLHAKATADTGLDDFGDDDYRERLDVYLAALQEITTMNEPGIVNHHAQLLQWLKNRLLLTDLLARHPEIHDIELLPPIVIAGLPRTGTTHLHNLLAAAPTFRTMPYWESNEPFPLPAEAGIEPDPRRTRMDVAVQVIDVVMPHFPLMHEMTTDHVHEEIQLLANDFSTMLFETLAHVPRWRDYYMAHDQTSHYEYLRDAAQGDAVSSRRSALAAQIAATPRAAAGAGQGLPRRLRHLHPPRPRAGDAVDAGDAHLQRAHVLLAGAGEGDRGDLGRSAGS